MKNITLAVALAVASLGAAHAQGMDAAPAEKQLHFVVGAGLTFGGDKLATAKYTNGGEIDVRAGSIVQLNAGIDYRVTEQFTFQATIGYHADNASGSNGDIRFTRYPMELLAYYQLAQNWRIGGGARYVSGAKLSSSGAGYVGNYDFDNTVSGVLEAEYLMTPNVGFKVRLVNEKFKETGTKQSVKANHIGMFANYYF